MFNITLPAGTSNDHKMVSADFRNQMALYNLKDFSEEQWFYFFKQLHEMAILSGTVVAAMAMLLWEHSECDFCSKNCDCTLLTVTGLVLGQCYSCRR